ncbi:hypothetical protein HanXRQr2_Chr15g0688581 [Helianthus annuus]|uniref:Uncharacterized protein n=1 Tax=Helianthus annuus TaxID=4232 RepID=A0A9K3H1R3_HELAN|nr:hypothetical protein HanXRQr2_Chr15g0688581 [Helianthus annuus]
MSWLSISIGFNKKGRISRGTREAVVYPVPDVSGSSSLISNS